MQDIETQGLTGQQIILAESLIQGNGLTKSAEKAGLGNPERDIVSVSLNPRVRRAAKLSIAGRIDIEGSPAAYRYMLRVLHDEEAPRAQRIEVARILLAHSHTPAKAKDEDHNDKEPAQMSNAELVQYIRESDSKLIDITPQVVQGIEDII